MLSCTASAWWWLPAVAAHGNCVLTCLPPPLLPHAVPVVLPQALFFTYTGLSTPDGFKWMGVMTIGMTALYCLMYWPQWGGMFTPAKEGVTEEDYYLSEWTHEERSQVREPLPKLSFSGWG